jgi:tRNA A-37 threonylcarbamoyl transferase component Bud32
MPFQNGQNVGPYRILEQLGQGGMATVYKAYHPALDRHVAIKVLHPAFREDPLFTARFTREARVVAKLEHPHIVPIYDFSEFEGQPYLVMKFIEGETLKARLSRGPLKSGEAVAIIGAVGEALSYAHSKGVLHRDIKPSNVLITADNIYLADFGLARMAAAGESTLSSDMLLGTPHYISPEQAQGVKNLDAGTDIYSLGVVMYELSVGRVPFNADTPFSIIHDHIFTPLPLPRAINPKVPPGVERVLLKALAKDRKDRYPDVDSEVKAFLQAIREATPTAVAPKAAAGDAKTPPAPPAAGKAKPAATGKKPPFWKRVPRWALGIPVALACICLCLFGIAVLGRNAEEKKAAATASAAALAVPASPQPRPTDGIRQPTATLQPAEPAVPPDALEAWSHFEKGLAYLDSGDQGAADREFSSALEMIPAGRAAVIRMAVDKLISRRQWIMAGQYLRKGLEANPAEILLREPVPEVLFHVAEVKDSEPLGRWFAEKFPDWSVPLSALGRWLALFSPNPQDGARYVQAGVDKSRTNEEKIYGLAGLGEYQCLTGNTAEGIVTLKTVTKDPNTPPWLRAEVERMIAKWQPT